MATLVQFLVAGVKGAESGTATFVLRGTASSAASVMYNDFEGTAQPGTNVITLDSNGAAEVYVDAYVDVTLRNSAGTILRTVTVGNSATLVEVQSDSFTGTDYDGNPANTAGEPITLAAVLDKWNDSAGATNWQVLVGGVSTNLQAALASGLTGAIINVKDPAYGAVGDGVTDDTTAIAAAQAVAAGAPVFFPKGTYKVSTLSIADANVNWLGAGPGASIISGNTSTTLIALTNNTNTAWKNFHGLSFTSSGTYDRLFLLEESQNVSFANCAFDASQCSADVLACTSSAGLSKYLFTDCDFTLGAPTPRGIYNQATAGNRHISVKGCNFKVPSGFTGSIIAGSDFNVEGSRFDASAVTTGTYYAVDAEDAVTAGKFVGMFTGNRFLDGGSDGYAFNLSGITATSDFSEADNTFDGLLGPADPQSPGNIYDTTVAGTFDETTFVRLGSRQGRTLAFHVDDDSSLSLKAMLAAETVFINMDRQASMSFTVDHTVMVPGCKASFIISNGDTTDTPRTMSITGSGDPIDFTSVAVDTQIFFGAEFFYRLAGASSLAAFTHRVVWSGRTNA